MSPAEPFEEQLQALQRRVLPVSQDGTLELVVGFHAAEVAVFSEAEQATLEALAELIGITVRNHFNATASLYLAAEVAHDFAALRDFETGDHLNRVSHYSRLIAQALAPMASIRLPVSPACMTSARSASQTGFCLSRARSQTRSGR